MTSLCITLVVASLFLSIYASAASAPIHKTTVWVAPETETLINGIPESQTPMVTDVIMGPYFYRYDYNQKTTVDKYRHIAHFSHDNRLNKLSEQMEAQITNSASQGAEWSGNVEFTAEIKKKIIESLKGTLGISYKETRTTNEAVGYKVVHTVPAGKVGHINLYYLCVMACFSRLKYHASLHSRLPPVCVPRCMVRSDGKRSVPLQSQTPFNLIF